MTNELAIASAEINEIFKYLSDEQVNKIPIKLRLFFEAIAEKKYIPHIDPNKRIIEQDITSKTKDILVIFYKKYWASEEEKEEAERILIENEQKYQAKLCQKYRSYNLFENIGEKSLNEQNIVQKEVAIVGYKESVLKKIINKIKSIF